MSDVRQASAGALTGIQDPIAAKEIRKLWDVVHLRSEQTKFPGQRWVTIDELNAAKREVVGKIPAVEEQKGFRQEIGGGGGTSIGAAGGGGVDLLPRNNTWTGTNTYTRKSVKDIPTMRLQSYNSGTIVPAGGVPTIMLETGYQAVLDIRKTTSAGADAVTGGGTAGIYVQHRVDSTTASIANVNSGIRVQMETYQRSSHPTNDVVSGYFGLLNHGFNSNGFGVHVDAYHTATGTCVTYGVSVESYRNFLDGKVIAFHARAVSSAAYNVSSDWAFLASPDSFTAPTGFKTIFGGGSDYIGNLQCEYGLDLGYAVASKGAIRVRGGGRIQLNGPADNVGLFFDTTGRIQFYSDAGDTIAIGNDGSLRVRSTAYVEFIDNSPSSIKMRYDRSALVMTFNDQPLYEMHINGTFGILSPQTAPSAGAEMGYFVINLGGFLRKVRFSAMS
ncbi:MAG TPA: hypothetical protein PKV98_04665 [Burkholderiaceae bacterium]|nr:hypothetical protein [Burkholderiaceae bacterium]